MNKHKVENIVNQLMDNISLWDVANNRRATKYNKVKKQRDRLLKILKDIVMHVGKNGYEKQLWEVINDITKYGFDDSINLCKELGLDGAICIGKRVHDMSRTSNLE